MCICSYVPLPVCKYLSTNVFCYNHLQITPKPLDKIISHGFKKEKSGSYEWSTRDSRFIKIADLVAALARLRCFWLTDKTYKPNETICFFNVYTLTNDWKQQRKGEVNLQKPFPSATAFISSATNSIPFAAYSGLCNPKWNVT